MTDAMTPTGWALAVAQALLYVALAPLLVGWVRLVKARLSGRRGPVPWQPYRDLRKLFGKETRIPWTASWLFIVAPYVVLVATVLAAATVPLIALELPTAAIADLIVMVGLLGLARVFLVLAGMDTGTAFGGFGASREMMVAALAEPALLMAVFTLAMTAHTTNLSGVVAFHLHEGLVLRPSYLFALGGLLLVAIAETGRLPVDNPSTHLELTMTHEAMLLEYSGRHLALMEWAAAIKLMLYGVLIVNVFVPWGIADARPPHAAPLASVLAQGTAVIVAKLVLLGAALALAETLFAKLRLFRVPNLLNLALLLALLGLLSHVILEVGA